MNLGENIYRLRTEHNMSQGDLADALDVSRQSVSKWENNSAVPELEKLIKMAEVFGISIDELVTGEAPEVTEPSQPEPKVVYIEKPARPAITPAQILGILLLFCTAFIVLLSFVFEEQQDIEEWLPLCLPVAVCGILCLVAKHPMLWCSWVAAFGYWLYFFVLSHHWEEQALLILLGILLVAAALLYTLWLHKKERIHVPAWGWAVLTLVLCIAALLLFVSIIPPFQGNVYIEPPAPMPHPHSQAAP